MEFAERFTALQGKFAFCLDEMQLVRQLRTLIEDQGWKAIYCRDAALGERLREAGPFQSRADQLAGSDVAITGCEYLVARTGSIVMSAAEKSGRNTSVYAPVHICVASTSQLVYDIKEALEGIQQKYGNNLPSLITFATGPSRTADIEKTLVVGVHGPKEVYVFLIDDSH